MTEVQVPYGDAPNETATLLLAAAEELELDASVVRTGSKGVFTVPEEVAKKAKVDTVDEDEDEESETEESDTEEKKPAKKAAAKKSAASK